MNGEKFRLLILQYINNKNFTVTSIVQFVQLCKINHEILIEQIDKENQIRLAMLLRMLIEPLSSKSLETYCFFVHAYHRR